MEEVSVLAVAGEYAYDVTASVLLSDSELQDALVVNCDLHIPSTTYHRQKTLHYYPGEWWSISAMMYAGYTREGNKCRLFCHRNRPSSVRVILFVINTILVNSNDSNLIIRTF